LRKERDMADHDTQVFHGDVNCTFCERNLDGTPVADMAEQFVHDFDGTLDYISLAHKACVLKDPSYDPTWPGSWRVRAWAFGGGEDR
jgi:hypothetical protein